MNSTELRQEKFRIADADGNGKLEGEDGEHRPGGGVMRCWGAWLKMDLKVEKADVNSSMGLGEIRNEEIR